MNAGVELISYRHQQSQALLGKKTRMPFSLLAFKTAFITQTNIHVNHQ